MATNFEPQEFVIFVKSTKIGINENKAIQTIIKSAYFAVVNKMKRLIKLSWIVEKYCR